MEVMPHVDWPAGALGRFVEKVRGLNLEALVRIVVQDESRLPFLSEADVGESKHALERDDEFRAKLARVLDFGDQCERGNLQIGYESRARIVLGGGDQPEPRFEFAEHFGREFAAAEQDG